MMMFSFHRFMKPMIPSPSSFQKTARRQDHLIRILSLNKYHNSTPFANGLDEPQPVCERTPMSNFYEILDSGMILFKNYINLKDQVDIVNICQKWGVGPGGFGFPNGAKLRLEMMCFGRNWDPVTKYNECSRTDGSEPPPLPYELISLAETAIQDAQAHLDKLPSMCPDICIVNIYSPVYGRLGLHQLC